MAGSAHHGIQSEAHDDVRLPIVEDLGEAAHDTANRSESLRALRLGARGARCWTPSSFSMRRCFARRWCAWMQHLEWPCLTRIVREARSGACDRLGRIGHEGDAARIWPEATT